MELKSVNLKETNIYELEVSIDGETFAAARKKAYAKAKKDIVIPGFRKGKVPMKMIESRYGEGFFYEDALEIGYPEAAEAAIKESELKFIAVNKDPHAPIFNYCDYGIVGDMDEVCDEMIRQLKK